MQYSERDKKRFQPIKKSKGFTTEDYRTPWSRDRARLMHSPCFRRLQGKTQLFPGRESDFFRNRLTHSLEVSQVARAIVVKLNHDLEKKKATEDNRYYINPEIVEFASLAHDLGHPPFGHFGEGVLNKQMDGYGGFESNAQTLRILTKLAKRTLTPKEIPIGMNLTFRSLASILKYDRKIPIIRKKRIKFQMLTKGYYYTESKMVKLIKDHVLKSKNRGKFKTIECQIMDIADDIAYSTYDLEDALKAEFLKPLDLISAPPSIVKIVAQKVGLYSKGKEKIRKIINEIFFDYFERPYKIEDKSQITLKAIDDLYFFSIRFANEQSQDIATNSYVRTDLTSKLVGHFIRNVHIDKIDSKNPALSVVKLKNDIRIKVEVLKHLIYELQIKSPKLKVVAYRSKEIIGTIFSVLIAKGGHELLPKDFRISYDLAKDVRAKRRVVCDFIAGMTDRYALEFYGRLKSENPQTIFKPI